MKIKNISSVKGTLAIRDPFILAAYHFDQYPEGNGQMGPNASLNDRNIGNDFDSAKPWRMYHGETIPGFPHHPHRGFEVITVVPEGYVDHFDSKGSKGRYGQGDVQLMNVGSGVLHSEMFPLIHDDQPNPLRLFQIWLNLPGKDKLHEPDYKMLWHEDIPIKTIPSKHDGEVKIKVILGAYQGVKSIDPLPNSWASNPQNHVGLALIEMDPHTEFTLEAVSPTLNRFVFFYEGNNSIQLESQELRKGQLADVDGNEEIRIVNNDQKAFILILEGEPINEPVAAYGPFVMNTERELQDAFQEYRSTQFGGWPWGDQEQDLVNAKEESRFASYHFGERIDRPNVK
ncbi:pirin family protein [Sphingobacterium sp. HJSM2_6]|uniref:pirin family protein n=1 Tax=Sphingobacterium sp. HJSM2_6 TaxID=3366264 RepID=UPI003BC26DF9